jgi:4-oxalocrotonate tautomerase
MPIVRIEMWPGRDEATKDKLIQSVTKSVCDSISCPAEAVTVVIQDIPKENWGMAGKQASKT